MLGGAKSPRFFGRFGSMKRQLGFIGARRMALLRKPWNPRDWFRNNEQGLVYEAYNPDDLLKRRNRATNTGFSLGTTGSVPTDYIERGLVTGRKTVDATTASGFCLRVTSTGGVPGSSDDVRMTSASGMIPGGSYTLRYKAKRAPGYTASTHVAVFGPTSSGSVALTDSYQTFTLTITATGNHSVFFGGANGALFDVSEVELLRTEDLSSDYQKVTDWSTEYLAATLAQCAMFQDTAGVTPVTAVGQSIGLVLDKRLGLVRNAEQVVNGEFNSDVTGWTAAGATLPTLTWVSGKLRHTGTSSVISSAYESFSVTAGRMYEIQGDISFVSGVADAVLALRTSADPAAGTARYTTTAITTGSVSHKFKYVATATETLYLHLRFGGATVTDPVYDFDNISFKEIPGNHGIQATAASKPKLEARYNLITKSEDINDAQYGKTNGSVTATGVASYDGLPIAQTFTENSAAGQHVYFLSTNLPAIAASAPLEAQFEVKSTTRRVKFFICNSGFTNAFFVVADLGTGTIVSQSVVGSGVYTSSSIEALAGGYYRVKVRGNLASGDTSARIACYLTQPGGLVDNYTGDGTSNVTVTRHQIRTVADASLKIPAYQRVNTATDYDTAGFPHYFLYDGVDDGWATGGAVDFTGTDKMTIVAGVTKLNDAATGLLVELSANAGTTAGTFNISTNANIYGIRSAGTAFSTVTTSASFTAPTSDVLGYAANISADTVSLRVNGTLSVTIGTDQGTGNYGNHTLYDGRRGGASLPLNGRKYVQIVRGAETPLGQIAQAERYAARLMRKSI